MNMSFYHSQLNKIKENGSKDYIKIKHNEKSIILKMVDESTETIHLLTEWRKLYRHMFASNFGIDEQRTKKWINQKRSIDSTGIQFMMYLDEQKVGIIGTDLEECGVQLDNMMKDPNCLERGLMTTVEKVYLKWMFDYLKTSKICGSLFTDNFRMLNTHLKCGWKIIDVCPLHKEITNDGWIWKETKLKTNEDMGERYFHIIELTRDNLMKKFGDVKYEILF